MKEYHVLQVGYGQLQAELNGWATMGFRLLKMFKGSTLYTLILERDVK